MILGSALGTVSLGGVIVPPPADYCPAPVVYADRVNLLISQFRDKAILNGILQTYLAQVQRIEKAAWEVINDRRIGVAIGDLQDRLGSIVLRGRNGLNDDDYNLALRAQILILRSKGRIQDLFKVAILFLPPGFTLGTLYNGGGTIILAIPQPALFDVATFWDSIVQLRPLGVQMQLAFSPYPSNATFTFGDTDDPTDNGESFGDSDDPTIGGRLSDVLTSL